MTRRAIKTILDAREAILALPRPGNSRVYFSARWSDGIDEQATHHSESYDADLWVRLEKRFGVTAPTPSDLYRNFARALNEHFAPRRIAAEQSRALARRPPAGLKTHAGDEHDGVRAGPRPIAATPVKRIAGPMEGSA